jgi:predicted RNase H-like HicB family nuclease/DNA-binding XRE family transcriptional regulator
MFYAAHVHREGKQWLAEFPDAPGCQTFADSAEELRAAAEEALEGWLEAHLVDGKSPPRPRVRHKAKGERKLWKVPVAPSLAAAIHVRWARQRLGLSQGQLAARVRVSQQQIAKLENPDENPTLKTIEKVAKALGMELHLSFGPAATSDTHLASRQ